MILRVIRINPACLFVLANIQFTVSVNITPSLTLCGYLYLNVNIAGFVGKFVNFLYRIGYRISDNVVTAVTVAMLNYVVSRISPVQDYKALARNIYILYQSNSPIALVAGFVYIDILLIQQRS